MQRRLVLFLCVVFCAVAGVWAAGTQEAPSLGIDDIAAPDAQRMLADIAALAARDDARMAGSEGEREAVQYVSGRFDEIELPTQISEFPVRTFRSHGAGFAYRSSGEESELAARAFMYSASTGGEPVEAPLVFAGLGRNEDFAGVDVRGAVALVERGEIYFSEKAARAAAAGAVALAIFNTEDEIIVGTLMERVDIPVVGLSAADGAHVVQRLNAGDTVRGIVWTDTETDDGTSRNVTALMGRSDQPFVVIGAHIDSVDTPGANDNASGIAVMLEVARMLQPFVPLPFAVRFAAFGAEEIGLIGSTDWANTMSRAERDLCIGMINLDSVGGGETLVGYASSAHHPGDIADAAAVAAATVGVRTDGLLAGRDRVSDSSDHASLARVGVPAIMLIGEPMTYIHSDADTIANVNAQMMVDTARVVATMVLDLAAGP